MLDKKKGMNSLDFICRLCLKCTPITLGTQIFSNRPATSSVDIPKLLDICVALKVQKNDGLPSKICKMCCTMLDQLYKFRKQCILSDKVLRSAMEHESSHADLLEFGKDTSIYSKLTIIPRENQEEEVTERIVGSLAADDETLDRLIKDDLKEQWANTRSIPPTVKNIKMVSRKSSRLPSRTKVCSSIKLCSSSEKENETEVEKVKAENFEDSSELANFSEPRDLFAKGKRRKLPIPRVSHPDADGIKSKVLKKKEVDYACRFCEKVYPSIGGRRYHIHTVHSQSFQPFICDLCGKSFKAKKNLEGHKNSIHLHMKQNLCDLCGRGFASKYGLKVHKIWHTGERNFHCETCGAKFRTKSKLNTHRTVHGGPKNFICEVCSRDFRWKKDFEIHLRTHTGEKPYACNVCGKLFASLTNKKKHERNHTQVAAAATSKVQHCDPAFSCDIAGLAYVSLSGD